MKQSDENYYLTLALMYEEAKWSLLRGIGKAAILALAWWVFTR